MAFTPPTVLDRSLIADSDLDRGSAIDRDRLIKLGSWMMILGTVRLICTIADYLNAFLESSRVQPFSFRVVSDFIGENQPVFALTAAWPLVLALALRRTRWPELLPAAAATFLILSIGGVVEFVAEWSHAQGSGVTLGSFHLTRRAFSNPTVSDAAFFMIGATQLVLELAAAVRAMFLVPIRRRTSAGETRNPQHSRRALLGRLAVYTAIGYLVLMVRLPVWSTYLELLNNSSLVREFVIRNDIQRIMGTTESLNYQKRDERLHRTCAVLTAALRRGGSRPVRAGHGQLPEGHLACRCMVEQAAPADLPHDRCRGTEQSRLAPGNLPRSRAPQSGGIPQELRRATELEPEDGNFWNTLGASYYRSGEWSEADRVLSHSMELRNGGDGFDWFFVALVHLKLGHKEAGLRWYEKAVDWFHRSLPYNQELYRFQVEAALELGLAEPPPLARNHEAKANRSSFVEPNPARLHYRVRSLNPIAKSRRR